MGKKVPCNIRFCDDAVNKRVKEMVDKRDRHLKNVDNIHVRLQKGNSKTGANCWTVSLIPIANCKNCSGCKNSCYDLRNDCFLPGTQNDRARNAAIYKADRKRYWDEVELQAKAKYITQLRLNVGGDIEYEDCEYIKNIGINNPKLYILFFTKSYDDLNRFYDEGNCFPENVHCIFSRWKGVECRNPYNFPEAHVLYEDGTTTAPEYGAIYCGGNCSECFFYDKGCWTLKKGEHVIFNIH